MECTNSLQRHCSRELNALFKNVLWVSEILTMSSPMQTEKIGTAFRTVLRQELKKKVDTNPSYSLRAFAKTLGVSASGLSMIMSGKVPVTLGFVEKVGPKLKLSETETHQHFLELLAEKNRSFKLKDFEFIDENRFTIIKDWYHYAILNLIRTKGFKPQPSWIAKRLSITLGEAQEAVERLQKVQFLKVEKDQWTDVSSKFTSHTNNKIFSEAAKQNQMQLFEKALQAIDQVEFQDRNHTGVTIAVTKKDLDKAKNFISKFRKEFMTHFDQEKNGDEVYHLSVGFFPLTKLQK